MTPDLHTRAKEIFLAACALDAAALPAYLDEACGGDAKLREEVESLLAFHVPATKLDGPAAEPRAPARLADRYEVCCELGRGGMGRVYQAVDMRFRRTVAVKELAVASAASRDAFEREARLLNGLRHRGLPVVTDYFGEGDRFFLVMDFVPGKDLKALISERVGEGEGPFPPETVLEWADQMLELLDYLHSHEPPIIHRDIKPQNLKLTPEGDVVLLDFGLAKGSVGPPSGRLASVAGYTPSFAPLEQVRGDGTDPRSDLFSLGVTLYYLLTGRIPPSAVERAEEILAGQPDPLDRHALERAPGVSPAIAAVLRRALSLRREERPASAAAMRVALDAARADDTVGPSSDTFVGPEPDEAAAGQATNPMTQVSPNNLPQQVSGFVGREREVDAVLALARSSRLVTLAGSGGIGKTRLALRVASDLLEDFPDGVWFVDLSGVSDAEGVAREVAGAVGMRDEPGDALPGWLRSHATLLVIDNCEHVVADVAALVDRLLRASARVRVLATSRERLGLRSEAVHTVGPMRVPEEGADPASVGARESVRLFVARARLLRPSFHLDADNAAAVASICRRLDGIPLAIELAAGRIGVLSVEQILDRLDDRFRLLASADRDAPARQQTLRGAVDWSYELLAEPQRDLFARLAVFPSSFSFEAAEALADPSVTPDVLDSLTRLVDKSFVTAEEVGAETRYRMIETIRQYALGRLGERGDAESANAALVAWARSLASESARQLSGARQREWLVRLDAERENLRAALAAAADDCALRLAGLETATALVRYWHLRGNLREARKWLGRFLELCPDAPAAALGEAHRSAGALANMNGAFAEAREHYEHALAAARETGEPRTIAAALTNLAVTLRDVGDLDAAARYAEEGLALLRGLDDAQMTALALMNLGAIEQDRANYARAAECLEESLGLKRATGDRFGVANALTNLAGGALRARDYGRAESMLAEALAIQRDLGEKRGLALTLMWLGLLELGRGRYNECNRMLREALELRGELADRRGMIDVVEAYVLLYAARREWERALVLAGAAAAARERLGAPIMPMDAGDLAEAVAAARRALGDEAAEAALARGRALPIERSAVDER